MFTESLPNNDRLLWLLCSGFQALWVEHMVMS
jgi:hypothetical protein